MYWQYKAHVPMSERPTVFFNDNDRRGKQGKKYAATEVENRIFSF